GRRRCRRRARRDRSDRRAARPRRHHAAASRPRLWPRHVGDPGPGVPPRPRPADRLRGHADAAERPPGEEQLRAGRRVPGSTTARLPRPRSRADNLGMRFIPVLSHQAARRTPAPSHAAPTAAAAWPRLRLAFEIVGVALIALDLGVFAARNVTLQGDFRTYVAAAKAAWLGLDPYRPDVLGSVAGRGVAPFGYPPVALAPFVAIGSLPYGLAATVWIVGKLALLAGLVGLWLRVFAPEAGLLPLALVAVFGWNAAALWDVRAGNVAIVECALVWSALACFVRGRRSAFAALVVVAACFKLLPAMFLLLLLVPAAESAPSLRRFAAAIAAWVAVIAT